MCVLCSVFLPLFPPQCGATQTSFPPPFPLLLLFCRAAGTKKVNFMEALWREGKREWDCTPAFGRTGRGRGISGSDFPSLFSSSAILPRRRPTDDPLPDLVRPPPSPTFLLPPLFPSHTVSPPLSYAFDQCRPLPPSVLPLHSPPKEKRQMSRFGTVPWHTAPRRTSDGKEALSKRDKFFCFGGK